MHLVDYIKVYYPQWYGDNSYPADKTVPIRKTADEWGILGNFASTPLTVDGVVFDCAERLYQVSKFTDPESRRELFTRKRDLWLKRTATSLEKTGSVRPDWGNVFIDMMSFCLVQKYAQSEAFRKELERSKGMYIVEDQSAFPKKRPDAWGTKISPDGTEHIGPNILGRLLMELRDTCKLDYTLPEDATLFQDLAR